MQNTELCLSGVDVCLDCVAEGSGCEQHLADMVFVRFSELYCKGICENGMEAYKYDSPPFFPSFHLNAYKNSLGTCYRALGAH